MAERLQIRASPQSQDTPSTPTVSEPSERNESSVDVNGRFTFLPNSEIGICSYCGRNRDILFWKDNQGNWLYEECKITEMRKFN